MIKDSPMRWMFSCLVVSTLAVGCASSNHGDAPATQPAASASASSPHDTCLVCEHNADLACVDVTVDVKTPRCIYDGKTYYFCSDDCRNAFLKSPQKYLSSK